MIADMSRSRDQYREGDTGATQSNYNASGEGEIEEEKKKSKRKFNSKPKLNSTAKNIKNYKRKSNP
jgi:hypothetical protein